jgi:hypothetical protein
MSNNKIAGVLAWLGGGEWRELGERDERSAHVIAGVVVLLGAALAWLVATLAVAESTEWSTAAILPLTFVFGLLVGAVSRAIAGGPRRGWTGVAGRAVVGLAVGVVVGELAAVVLFSGSIDRLLDERAARSADSSAAVVQAATELDRTRDARTALDGAVEEAGRHRDEALVVARCEFHPTPGCPQTHITGVPGAGPENRTANDFLTDTQRELDNAVAERDRRGAGLDSQIADDERALTQARESVIADADRGLGARWVAMNDHTFSSPAAMLVRLVTIGFFALLILLPLILKLWRGQTSQDRGAAARAERERAELEADTAIAVKRAEVRAAVETMWAEQQLASARLAVEAQTEIDREEQRRRVIEALEVEALEAPMPVTSERVTEPAELETREKLPALIESAGAVEPRRDGGNSLIPSIPDVTKAAARFIRPFVPPIIASAIETTTKPLRSARQSFEEVEEIHFSLKRTHKVTVQSEESESAPEGRAAAITETDERRWVESSKVASDAPDQVTAGDRHQLMTTPDSPPVLDGSDGPRQLPPGES